MIGVYSLNLSFILHLIVYLPQVLHNRNKHHIRNLSIFMHLILFFCYFLDIFYGFSSKMQWQYRTVSIVGFSLLIIQYSQIIYFHIGVNRKHIARLHTVILAASIYFIIYFFIELQTTISYFNTMLVGYISKIFFIISVIPQIIKNWRIKSASAINTYFILLSITIASLDTITAWCLNWGWPNKLTSPIMVCLLALLLPLKKTSKTELART